MNQKWVPVFSLFRGRRLEIYVCMDNGSYIKCENIHELGQISSVTFDFTGLRKWIQYTLEYRRIRLDIYVFLES